MPPASPEVSKDIHQIFACAAILDCRGRYCRDVDRREAELLRTPDRLESPDDHGVLKGSGYEFVEWLIESTDGIALIGKHHLTSTTWKSTAHGECEKYCLAIQSLRNENTGRAFLLSSGGRCLDQFRERDGRWATADRVATMSWSRPVLPGAGGRWIGPGL